MVFIPGMLLLGIINSFYALVGVMLALRKTRLFALVILMLLFSLHTFLFGHFRLLWDSYRYAFSSCREVAFLGFALMIGIGVWKAGQTRLAKYGLALALLGVYGSLRAFSNGLSLMDQVVAARDFLLPLCFYFIIRAGNITLTSRGFTIANGVMVAVALASGLYAFWLNFTFNGDVRTLWFYPLYATVEKGVSLNEVNYIREDALRAFGLFASPLEYAFTALYALYITFGYFLRSRRSLLRWGAFAIHGLLLSMALLSRVRSWLFCYAIGMVLFMIIRYRARLLPVAFVLLPVLLVAITFWYLGSDYEAGKDMSAMGRLVQYAEFTLTITDNPLGYGLGSAGAKSAMPTDSSLLTVFIIWGLAMAPVFIGLTFLMYRPLLNRIAVTQKMVLGIDEGVALDAAVVFGSAYWYLFFFQNVFSLPFSILMTIILGFLGNVTTRDTIK